MRAGNAATTKDTNLHEGKATSTLACQQVDGGGLSWTLSEGVIELALHRAPCNELGSASLEELEKFATALQLMQAEAHALIIYSELNPGFCAGADLRELYQRSQAMENAEAARGVRDFLERIHRVLNLIDAAPLTTIAAVHGVTFGGGFELALACDLINCRQDGAVLLSGIEAGVDSRVWWDSATEAGFGQRGSEGPAADRAQH